MKFAGGAGDPGPYGWLLDLAFESGAEYLVSREKHLLEVGQKLGFRTVTPPEVLGHLKLAD